LIYSIDISFFSTKINKTPEKTLSELSLADFIFGCNGFNNEDPIEIDITLNEFILILEKINFGDYYYGDVLKAFLNPLEDMEDLANQDQVEHSVFKEYNEVIVPFFQLLKNLAKIQTITEQMGSNFSAEIQKRFDDGNGQPQGGLKKALPTLERWLKATTIFKNPSKRWKDVFLDQTIASDYTFFACVEIWSVANEMSTADGLKVLANLNIPIIYKKQSLFKYYFNLELLKGSKYW
jgi:hypothetical protein